MTINNINDLCTLWECDEPERLSASLYNGTRCGAWLEYDAEGVTVGTIVEGSDAEFTADKLVFPFEDDALDEAIAWLEGEAEVAWNEANGDEEESFDYGVCPESEVYRDTTEHNHICDASDWADDVEGAIKLAREKAAEDGENYTVMKYYRDGGDCAWGQYLTVEPDGSAWSPDENVRQDAGWIVGRL